MTMRRLLIIGLAWAYYLHPVSAFAAELIMFDASECEWCERWNKEVGVVYKKTDEGRVLPLRRVDIHGRRPSDLEWISKITFTPTFVLIEGGKEIGRITGYPGEDHFWGQLGILIKNWDRGGQQPKS